MDSDEYRRALAALGLNQTGATGADQFLGVSERTARRWAVDGPPLAVAMLLRLMVARKMRPDGVRERYGQ